MGFWQDRRVFITGCTGLVARWTVRALLERGAHVVGLVRDQSAHSELVRNGDLARIDVVRGSLEDQPLLERAMAEYEIQTVFHLAAQTIVGIAQRTPLSTFESNIKGTWCLLEAARRCGFHPDIVVASSDKAYGEQTPLPYTEEAPLLGNHPYDVSKACADMIASTYANTYGMPVCITRCGNFYGGGDLNWNRLIPGTIRSILRNERPILRSDGTLVRDYFYVRDGATAYLHLAKRLAERPELAGEAFNFSSQLPMPALGMVKRLLRLMHSPLEPDVRNETCHEIEKQSLSADKAWRVLGWEPKYELDDALLETIAWYRNHLAKHDRVIKRAA